MFKREGVPSEGQDWRKLLARKLYLFNVGMYLSFGAMAGGTYLFKWLLHSGFYTAFPCALCLVIILRTVYESIMIYERPLRSISFLGLILYAGLASVATVSLIYVQIKHFLFLPPIATISSVLILLFVQPKLIRKCAFRTISSTDHLKK